MSSHSNNTYNNNSKTFSKKESLRSISLEGNIKVILPKDFINKVEAYCSYSPKHEWSGILFYEVKGSIKKPSSMQIICKDILLMDLGTATFTSYDFDKELIPYYRKNPAMLSCKYGQIHSHNTMRTFFSGTDVEDLEDNSPNHNFYLSLIVNNFLETTARVAFIGEAAPVKVKYNCSDEHGEPYVLTTELTTPKTMFWYDCDVELKKKVTPITEEIKERIIHIEEKKAASMKQKQATYNQNQKQNNGKAGSAGYGVGYNKNNKQIPASVDKEFLEHMPIEGSNETDYQAVADAVDEQFACYCLRLGNEVKADDIDKALEDLTIANMNENSYLESFMNNYVPYYSAFFNVGIGDADMDSFVKTTEKVCELIEEYKVEEPICDKIVNILKKMLEEINKNEIAQ